MAQRPAPRLLMRREKAHDRRTEVLPVLREICHGHFSEWERFRSDGGVRRELENVVPYAKQTP
jgi:hypothetical protein